jgi:hypothetical protein
MNVLAGQYLKATTSTLELGRDIGDVTSSRVRMPDPPEALRSRPDFLGLTPFVDMN